MSPEKLLSIFGEISEWIENSVGIKLELSENSFKSYPNKRGKLSTQGKIGFIGPEAKPTTPKVKLDLANDEFIASPSERRRVIHDYSDWNSETSVLSYSLEELAAEKIRALAQRCRPRDLYDVIHLCRNPNLVGRDAYVKSLLQSKSKFVGISTPTLGLVQTDENYQNILADWAGMLGHQLPPPLIPAEIFWNKLPEVFDWLDGQSPIAKLSPAEIGNDGSVLLSPSSVNSARHGFDINLLRYCAFNLVKIELYYVPEKGEAGWRLVEPYSFRGTQDGHILLYLINDRGHLRSYRLDRIQGIRASHEPFIPKFRVEI